MRECSYVTCVASIFSRTCECNCATSARSSSVGSNEPVPCSATNNRKFRWCAQILTNAPTRSHSTDDAVIQSCSSSSSSSSSSRPPCWSLFFPLHGRGNTMILNTMKQGWRSGRRAEEIRGVPPKATLDLSECSHVARLVAEGC